jgi:hypothetical protein
MLAHLVLLSSADKPIKDNWLYYVSWGWRPTVKGTHAGARATG